MITIHQCVMKVQIDRQDSTSILHGDLPKGDAWHSIVHPILTRMVQRGEVYHWHSGVLDRVYLKIVV